MKIRIIDADKMGVNHTYYNGDIIEVAYNIGDVYRDMEKPFEYLAEWEGKHFEFVEEENVKWTGEGLPPVGEKIMIRGTPSGSICEGVIDYIDKKHCVWHWFDEPSERTMYNRTFEMEFEPLKSQEEIEKDIEIDELSTHLDEWFNNIVVCPDNTYDDLTLSQYLYNLGYRKTE